MGPQETSTVADTENSPPHKKHRYLCTFSDKMSRENFEIGSKKGDTYTYCVTRSADISIGNRAID